MTIRFRRCTRTTWPSSHWCGPWVKQSSAREVSWEENKVPDPVKISPQYDEEEDVKEPERAPDRNNNDERRSNTDRRGFAQRRLGYFRTHPRAKWVGAADEYGSIDRKSTRLNSSHIP